jgi:apolipoprotein N-acyltransferase
MASAVDVKRLGFGLAAVLITALLVWFGTGLAPFWPLMWFAPLSALLFASRGSWWGTALVAFGGWFLGNLNLWDMYHRVLGLPAFLIARIVSTEALVFALSVLLFRALLRRRAWWSALAAVPAVCVSVEYLLNLVSPHGTAGSLAYSQLNFLPFLQLASITGPWGMSFLLLLFSSAIALAVHLWGTERKLAIRVAGAGLGVIGLVLVFGAVRLMLPAPGQPVKVGLIASDAPTSPEVADEGAPTAKLFDNYAVQVRALASQGAQVIVLPEKLGVTVDPDTKNTDAMFQSLADSTHADIVVGMIRVVPPSASDPVNIRYNEARVYRPGAEVLSYDKEHMLPPYESKFKPGTTLTLLSKPSGTWGVAICKDMDFTPLSRRYGQAGAGLLLVPAWDFNFDRLFHGHMALMRGVESGFGIVRAAKNGFLTVSDNRGRVLAETTSDSAPFATLVAEVPAVHDNTLYLMLGDWFAWLPLAVLAAILVSLAFKRR